MTLYPLSAINLNMLQIQGRTDIFLYIEIIKKILAIGPLAMGIFLSVYWMLLGTILASILSFILNSYYTGRSMGYSSWMQLKDVALSYLVGVVIAFSVYFLKFLPFNCWTVLSIQLIVGSLVFFVTCTVLKLPEYYEIKDIIGNFIMKMRRNY